MFTTEVWTNAEGQAALIVTGDNGFVVFCRILSIEEGVKLIDAGVPLNHDALAEFDNTGI